MWQGISPPRHSFFYDHPPPPPPPSFFRNLGLKVAPQYMMGADTLDCQKMHFQA